MQGASVKGLHGTSLQESVQCPPGPQAQVLGAGDRQDGKGKPGAWGWDWEEKSYTCHTQHLHTLLMHAHSRTCTYDAHTHIHVHTCTHVRAHPELRLFCFLIAGPWWRLCPSQESALSRWVGVGPLPSLPLSTWGANWPPSLGPAGNSLFWVCPSQYQQKTQARGVLPGAVIRESLLWPNPGHFLGFCDRRLPWPRLFPGSDPGLRAHCACGRELGDACGVGGRVRSVGRETLPCRVSF